RLMYKGRVGTGFNNRQLEELHAKLQQLERSTAPISASVPDVRATHWVRPELIVEIKFSEYTQDGRLRHPVFRGLREDKKVADIKESGENPTSQHAPRTTRRKASGRRGGATVAGVRLTHPDRVLYPEMGVTKL